MVEILLKPMTRELCHKFYRAFENDPAIYMDMGMFKEYVYDEENVNKYFENQMSDDRMVFMIMQNDSVKGNGIGTAAEKMALEYAFKELGMKKVNADAVHKNKRSQHVIEKVGFQFIKEDEMFKYYSIER